MRRLCIRARYRFVLSVVIHTGLSNLAEVPVASLFTFSSLGVPDVLPARVVTTPVEITIFRILSLSLSATYRFVPSVVIPSGALKLAEVPVL